jgi:DNA-binding transcriptional regulator/RsmH inhibitor MraZ
MRNQASPSVEGPATSLVARRTMRRFGALSQGASISNQGRITVPPMFREYADLLTGEQVVVSGCETGVELWNPARWEAELATIHQHVRDKGAQEMSADLRGGER